MSFVAGVIIAGIGGTAFGLFLGWNLLAQPIWIRDWFIRKGWIKTPAPPVVP